MSSVILVIREMQIKIIATNTHLLEWLKSKDWVTYYWQGCERAGTLVCSWNFLNSIATLGNSLVASTPRYLLKRKD